MLIKELVLHKKLVVKSVPVPEPEPEAEAVDEDDEKAADSGEEKASN